MPMGTLELPRSMIDAATSYAGRENVSVIDLFAKLLHRQYGYVLSVQIAEPSKAKRKVKISPRVHALRGIAKLSDSRPYKDVIADTISEKFENLK